MNKYCFRFIIFLVYCISFNYCFSQIKFYNFNLYDGRDYLATMNQSNDLFLNSSRVIGNEILSKELSVRQKFIYFNAQLAFASLIGQAITHEEGHRSVLSELGIGSVSKPFIDKNLVAKVTGVSSETLLNLRNNDFPSYIRLHTAGLESDYAYLKKEDNLFGFSEENIATLYGDYLARKMGTQFYYISLLLKLKSGIKEGDSSDLERDIVGHDLYGMIRHLHRPTMNFYRYTEYNDLTVKEQNYAKRMGYMSLFNLLNPNIWRGKQFNLSKNVTGNFSVNYSLTPFGDFIEQNAYLTIHKKYKINPYFRQYFNKSYTFIATGINIHNYDFNKGKFLVNSSLHLWNQPKNLDFETNSNKFGFGAKSEVAIRISSWNENKKSAYLNIGASYKTEGFLPEAPSLKEDFRVHLGIVLSSKK